MKQYIILGKSDNGDQSYKVTLEYFLNTDVLEFKSKYDYVSVYECKFITSYYNNNK